MHVILSAGRADSRLRVPETAGLGAALGGRRGRERGSQNRLPACQASPPFFPPRPSGPLPGPWPRGAHASSDHLAGVYETPFPAPGPWPFPKLQGGVWKLCPQEGGSRPAIQAAGNTEATGWRMQVPRRPAPGSAPLGCGSGVSRFPRSPTFGEIWDRGNTERTWRDFTAEGHRSHRNKQARRGAAGFTAAFPEQSSLTAHGQFCSTPVPLLYFPSAPA